MSRSACYFEVGGPKISTFCREYKFFVIALRIFIFLRTKCKFDYDFLGLFKCDIAADERISVAYDYTYLYMQIELLHETRNAIYILYILYSFRPKK